MRTSRVALRLDMNILTFTTLYPNSRQPRHGIFVEQRLRHLLQGGGVRATVIAPVPWFPSSAKLFGKYACFAGVPRRESRHSIDILHPRFPAIPKVGMNWAPELMVAGVWSTLKTVDPARFDLIDAHYFYPDGVAAAELGNRLGKPVVITARGTDINLIPRHPIPRRKILRAAERSAAIITVCQALKDALLDMGVPEYKMTVLRNGVDLELFRPLARDEIRRELGLYRFTLISVGHLIERKGHHYAIDALQQLDGVELIIVGDGEEEESLRRLAIDCGVADRVQFVGHKEHEELCRYYNAADALVLASSREGMANVLLESLACGTPVVATASWGTPEVVTTRAAGVLMRERSADAVALAVKDLMADRPDRTSTRTYAETFSWDNTSAGQQSIFERVLNGGF